MAAMQALDFPTQNGERGFYREKIILNSGVVYFGVHKFALAVRAFENPRRHKSPAKLQYVADDKTDIPNYLYSGDGPHNLKESMGGF